MVRGNSSLLELRVFRYPDIELVLRYGYCFPLSFSFEELSLMAKSTHAAAIVDGRYSRKAAVRIV